MTQLNPNIILGVQRQRSTSPQEMYAQKAQFDQNELAQRMGQMKMQAFEQERADANQLRSVYSQFGKDTESNVNALYKAGLGGEAAKYSKSQADLAKDRATGDKTKIETVQKVVGLMGSTAFALSQSPTLNIQEVAGAVEQLKAQLPQEYHGALDVSKLPQDPAGLRAALQGIYTKSIETEKLLADQTSRRNNDQTNATSRANNQANNAVQMRGQNMTDARSRESAAATLTKPFEITGEDGKPVLVQQDKQGNIRKVEGYTPKQGASKPLTEGQSKALLFGSRMQEAGAILDDLAAQGTTKSVPGSRAAVVGPAITAMSGEKNQKLEQAKRDFINATLRRESGAVIADSEFDNAEKQYFPQIGDAPAVIAQKKRNREVATRGILAEVPDSDNRVNKVRGGATGDFSKPAAPNIDALLDKYK